MGLATQIPLWACVVPTAQYHLRLHLRTFLRGHISWQGLPTCIHHLPASGMMESVARNAARQIVQDHACWLHSFSNASCVQTVHQLFLLCPRTLCTCSAAQNLCNIKEIPDLLWHGRLQSFLTASHLGASPICDQPACWPTGRHHQGRFGFSTHYWHI